MILTAIVGPRYKTVLPILKSAHPEGLLPLVLVARAATPEALAAAANTHHLQLIFLTWPTPPRTLAHLQQLCPQAALVQLAPTDDADAVLAALRAGASGCIPTNIGLTDLLYTCEYFLKGGPFLRAQALAHLIVLYKTEYAGDAAPAARFF